MHLLKSLFGDDAAILRQRDFQALLLVNTFPVMGTVLLSPILDSLIDPFGTSAGDVGLLISFFSAPAVLMIPLGGLVADRLGRKPVLVSALLVYGVSGTALAFTTEFVVALGLRFVQGMAFGGIAPVIITSIGDIYDGTRETTGQGFRFMESGLSSTVIPLLSGLLVTIGWQVPFSLFALAIVGAAIVFLWFDEPTTEVQRRSVAESETGGIGTQITAVLGLLRNRKVSSMILARGLPMFVWAGFLTYNSIIVVRIQGGTPTEAGIIVAVGSITYATVASQAGRITQVFDSRFAPLTGANACLGIGFAAFLLAPSLPLAGVGISIVGVGFGLTLSLYRSIITGLTSDSRRGGVVSLAEAFGRLIVTVTPIIVGGVITLATPYIGFQRAIQAVGLGLAVLSGVGGILAMVVVANAPDVDPDR